VPVGRLDLTEGLLLTNDGELERALELPATGIPALSRPHLATSARTGWKS
jgi:23S rRNA pseudouridine2605 synthase